MKPPSGPLTGGTWIAIAGNHFRDRGDHDLRPEAQALLDLHVVNANRIEGRMPAR